jgi:hypothetical protein
MMRLRSRSRVALILTSLAMLALSAGVLGYLVYQDRDALLVYARQLRPGPLLLIPPIFWGALLVAAGVWAAIMHALGSAAAISVHLRYYFLSHVAKRLPGTLWYIAGRGVLYRQQGDSLRLVTVASGLELVVAVVSGTVVSAVFVAWSALALADAYRWLLLSAAGVGLATLHPQVVGWIMRRVGLAPTTELGYRRLLGWLAAYALIWVSGGVILFLVARAFVHLPAALLPYFVASWSLVGVVGATVLVLPSNLGITEVGLSLLLTQVMPSSVAVAVAVMVRLLLIGCEVVGALVVIALGALQDRGKNARPESPLGV